MEANQTQSDRPWRDVAGGMRDFLAGYERGREDAPAATPDAVVALARGVNEGLTIARKEAHRERRDRAAWEHAIDRDLDDAQRFLREGNRLEAHRAISRVRRSLGAPHDARIARMGLP